MIRRIPGGVWWLAGFTLAVALICQMAATRAGY